MSSNNQSKATANADIFRKSEKISVSHGFFGRIGGNSDGLYASLNCSRYVGDKEEAVEENFDVVRSCLIAETEKCSDSPSSISDSIPVSVLVLTLKQVHSNICLEVSADDDVQKSARSSESRYAAIEADALITQVPGIAIGVLTADCAPVLFHDPVRSVVGAAHAGWRGAVGGVLESTVRKMREVGCNPGDIHAAIGPCIGPESYEIDEEFMRNFSGSGECFCLVNRRLHFDLPKFCRKRLLAVGLSDSNIDTLGIDTCANHDRYFSYRFARQNSDGVCGRQISAIGLL